MSGQVFDAEVIIESITPIEGEALRVVMILPKDNFEAQKHALELFFNQSMRSLLENPKVQKPRDEAG